MLDVVVVVVVVVVVCAGPEKWRSARGSQWAGAGRWALSERERRAARGGAGEEGG